MGGTGFGLIQAGEKVAFQYAPLSLPTPGCGLEQMQPDTHNGRTSFHLFPRHRVSGQSREQGGVQHVVWRQLALSSPSARQPTAIPSPHPTHTLSRLTPPGPCCGTGMGVLRLHAGIQIQARFPAPNSHTLPCALLPSHCCSPTHPISPARSLCVHLLGWRKALILAKNNLCLFLPPQPRPQAVSLAPTVYPPLLAHLVHTHMGSASTEHLGKAP